MQLCHCRLLQCVGGGGGGGGTFTATFRCREMQMLVFALHEANAPPQISIHKWRCAGRRLASTPDCFIIAAIISSLSLTPGDESAGDIKESGGEIITRRSIPAPLAGPPPRMDFQVEPCCNYLCKLKDISRRLSGCEGPYNFIRGRSGESAPAGRSRSGPDECFQESCKGGRELPGQSDSGQQV